jgi:hypothetical protein
MARVGGRMSLENQSVSSRTSRARFATSDQTLHRMHAVRISRPRLHTESHEEAVQNALLTGRW